MASTYDVGDLVRTSVTFTSTAGTAADPSGTIRFGWKNPAGISTFTASTGTGSTDINKSTTGVYFYDLVTTGRGVYWTRFESTGDIVTAEEAYFLVRAQQVSS